MVNAKTDCSILTSRSGVVQAMINEMRKEIFESGHIHRDRGARRVMQEGPESAGSTLSAFMHATARDKFLPLLGADCLTMNAQVIGRRVF